MSTDSDHRLVVTGEASALRRRLGPTAWVVFEELLLASTGPTSACCATVSVRSLAASLGLAKDTVARALVRLRAAGLVTVTQSRSTGGVFAASNYELRIPPGINRQAQERGWSTNAELRHSKGLKRRRLRHQVGEASEDLAAAQQRRQVVEEATLPDTKLFRDADLEVRKLMMQLRAVEGERRTALGTDGTDGLTRVRDALFDWRCWAEGRPVPPDVIVATVEEFRDQRMIKSAYAETLLKPLEVWCDSHGIQPPQPAIQPAPVERAPDLGIGL